MQLIMRQESRCTWEPHSNQRWRDAICLSPVFHDKIFMMTFMTEALPVWKRSCTRSHGSCLSTHFFFLKRKNAKKGVIYFLVADVPVSPVWCVFATSVCRPKCSSRDLCCSVPALASLCHNGAFHHKLSTPCWLFFSPRLLCPYITPKTAVMRCCKDREEKKKRRMGNGAGDSGCERGFWNIPTLLRRCRYRRARHSPRERLKSKLFVKTP